MKQIWNNRVKVSSWQETSQQNPSDMSYAGGQGLTYTEGKGVKQGCQQPWKKGGSDLEVGVETNAAEPREGERRRCEAGLGGFGGMHP